MRLSPSWQEQDIAINVDRNYLKNRQFSGVQLRFYGGRLDEEDFSLPGGYVVGFIRTVEPNEPTGDQLAADEMPFIIEGPNDPASTAVDPNQVALAVDAQSLEEGPVAIFDVTDDPRLQYPTEAVKEGISSILSVPVVAGGRTMGALRVYTSDPWEFTLDDVNFVQAMAYMVGMAIVMARHYKGFKESIEVLKAIK